MGYEIVRIQMQEGHRKTLQVMLDRVDGKNISVNDCEQASRQISAVMDVDDPIEGAYNLEVSSPGIDRPLTREKDFERFSGYDAKIALIMPQDGRKRFSGVLKGVDQNNVIMKCYDMEEDVALPMEQIATAKLILTDALFAAHAENENENNS
jgi:ribosome maturation factor RimP